MDDHEHVREGEPMHELFYALRKRLLNINSSVKEEPQKVYIAYKSSTNFVDIIAQKNSLRLSLNIPYEQINDPENRCKDVSGKGRWGNGKTELKITSHQDLDYALFTAKQAFDKVEDEDAN